VNKYYIPSDVSFPRIIYFIVVCLKPNLSHLTDEYKYIIVGMHISTCNVGPTYIFLIVIIRYMYILYICDIILGIFTQNDNEITVTMVKRRKKMYARSLYNQCARHLVHKWLINRKYLIGREETKQWMVIYYL